MVSFVAVLTVVGGLISVVKVFFYRMGDLLDESAAVEMQIASPDICLYGSLAARNHQIYKLKLYEAVKPDIVVIGSSRVLQFKDAMFTGSFLNLGRILNTLNTGEPVIRRLLQIHRPKLVLMGIDFWWFNSAYKKPKPQNLDFRRVRNNDMSVLVRLLRKSLKTPAVFRLVPSMFAPRRCPIGVAAKTYLNGFGADGFRYYGRRLIIAPEDTEDYRFLNTKKRIEGGNKRFQYASDPEPVFIERFIRLVAMLEENGVETVLYFPPLAPAVYAHMQTHGEYRYIPRLKEILAARGLNFLDFHDPASLGLTDCEFLDGFHAGDTAHGKMLQEIVRRRPSIGRHVDRAELDKLAAMKPRAAHYISAAFNIRENDFLGIGCLK